MMRRLGALILGIITAAVVWRLAWLPDSFLVVVAALVFGYLYWALFFTPGLSYDAPTKWSIAVSKWLFVIYFIALAVLDYRIVVRSGVKWLLIALAVEAVLTPICFMLFVAAGNAAGALAAKRDRRSA